MITIRDMELDDIEDAIELGSSMHGEGHFHFLPYDREKLNVLVEGYVVRDDRFAVVAEDDGHLVGMLLGYLDTYYFCDKTLANDLLWYVSPEKRGGMTGINLLRRYIEWAKKKGAQEVGIGISIGIKPERVGALLERLGFANVGGSYKMRF